MCMGREEGGSCFACVDILNVRVWGWIGARGWDV